MSRPEEVENAAGTRHAVCLSPAPGGVEFVMSPQLTSCQVGWRESSAGGFRHAELARREVGWILSHWARIAQAGPSTHRPGPTRARVCAGPDRPGPGLRQPGPRQCEVGRTDLGPSRARLRIPVPSRLAPFQAGSTRSSGNPRERTSTRELVT